MVSFNPLYPNSLTLSLPIADTYGSVRLAEEEEKKKGVEEESKTERDRDEGGGGTKKVWLTSLILFPHPDAFQIDLHTAKCPLSLGLAVVGALKCTKPE